MSESTKSRVLPAKGPNYVGWRGELLAELALSRLEGMPGIQIVKLPEGHE